MRFEGKVAIITAAGAGIGRATTEIIVREGGTVVAVENQQARLDAMAQALANQPGKVVPMCIDAMDEAQAKQAVQDVADRFGHIDILVNAVGGSTIIPKPDVKSQFLLRLGEIYIARVSIVSDDTKAAELERSSPFGLDPV